MLTKEELAEVYEATDRIDAAVRGVDALLNTERDRDLVTNPRVSKLRRIKGELSDLSSEIAKLYA